MHPPSVEFLRSHPATLGGRLDYRRAVTPPQWWSSIQVLGMGTEGPDIPSGRGAWSEATCWHD